jgi:hypothetical protein
MYGFSSFWFSIALLKIYFYFVDYMLEGTYTGNLNLIIESFNPSNYILLYFYLYFFSYMLINIISLILLFIWFSLKAEKEFRVISSVKTVGFTITLIGWIFEITIIKQLGIISPMIPPIFIIAGVLTSNFPLLINVDFFSKSLANWLVITLMIGIFIYLGLTIFTNFSLTILSLILIWISVSTLIGVVIYITFKVVRRNQTNDTSSSIVKEELKDFIKIFTKPSTITIEEIQVYREKGLCLVCKGKVSGVNYICPKCNALYCLKCSEVLTKRENACWVCESPFDVFKSNKIDI